MHRKLLYCWIDPLYNIVRITSFLSRFPVQEFGLELFRFEAFLAVLFRPARYDNSPMTATEELGACSAGL